MRLLQAQIEPHFLFNSLANVVSLIDSNPDKARTMLEHLSDFLRISLQRTRSKNTTVRDEINLLNAYLEIQQVRMGDRLIFSIDSAETLLDHYLPALLVQPLVENAVKHGLENSVDGGAIQVQFRLKEQALHISVMDSGAGMLQGTSKGVGLTNVRERLQLLYGDSAALTLSANKPTGVRAELVLPNSATEEPPIP